MSNAIGTAPKTKNPPCYRQQLDQNKNRFLFFWGGVYHFPWSHDNYPNGAPQDAPPAPVD